jgi:hypothetical protein
MDCRTDHRYSQTAVTIPTGLVFDESAVEPDRILAEVSALSLIGDT